jgi:hypothetical protein
MIPRDPRLKALLRMSTAVSPQRDHEHDIVKYLTILDLQATRISRRPSLDAIPFRDVYFVEVCGHSSECELPMESWRTEVEKATLRVEAAGGKIELIGIW